MAAPLTQLAAEAAQGHGRGAKVGTRLIYEEDEQVKPRSEPDDLTDEDRRSLVELAALDARSALLGRRVCRALALGLLHEGVRHFGRWAGQLQFGRLSILCVVLDRDDQPRGNLRA